MRSGFFSKAVRERAFQVADLRGGKIAVDVGAGTGFITEGLVGKGLQVIAVDPSERMLGEMRRKFQGIEGEVSIRRRQSLAEPQEE
nr:methyltransferase domain-containing protein [Anaerolineae bacterium]